MLRVATVHWKTEEWIDVQLRYFERYLPKPYQVYACIGGGIDPARHRHKFHRVVDSDLVRHFDKLDLLGATIVEEADAADQLIFIDSDAFPIRPLGAFLSETLKEYPLVAVRRDENLGDKQPHPCFCATTVGFWQAIEGTWTNTHPWINDQGQPVRDVGGDLLKLLNDRGLAWKPLLRSNRIDLHPVLFAVYADLIYHHTAGSRRAGTRLDKAESGGEFGAAFDRLVDRNDEISGHLFDRILAGKPFLHYLGCGPLGLPAAAAYRLGFRPSL